MKRIELLAVIAAFTAVVGALAQVPSIINYQGRLSAGGTNVFHGRGQFKFALVNGGTNMHRQATAVATSSGGFLTIITVADGGSGYAETPTVTIADATGSNAIAKAAISGGAVAGITVVNPGRHYSASPSVTIAPPPPDFAYTTFWSNDGSSTGGGEPAQTVPLAVNQGVFSVNLGDTGISNMTAVIPSSIFSNSDVRLRIWFSDGVAGFQRFFPDQRLTSAGYAMMAANVADGAITGLKLAPGAVGTSALAANSISSVNIADGAITSDKLADGAVTGAKLAQGSVPWVPNAIAVFTSSGNFINPRGATPNDVLRAYVKLWGGGGGGLASRSGGGGGGYCEGFVTFAGNQTVTVGSAGLGGSNSDTSGGVGGDSVFLDMTARGGGGGGSIATGGIGGAGGSASGGSINLTGQNGGSPASGQVCGEFGGDSPFGGGGGGDPFGGSGLVVMGKFPGGGGGAGCGGVAGGSGAAGLIIIYY